MSIDRQRYALFVSVPLVGHMNPLLRQAEELARRGYDVALASTAEARSYVEGHSKGVRFLDLGSMGALQAVIKETEREGAASPDFGEGTSKMTGNLIDLWPVMYDGLSAVVERRRPDVMVVNLAAVAGMDVADREGIPIVINNPYMLSVLPSGVLPAADDLPPLLSGISIHDVGRRHRVVGPLRRLAARVAISMTIGRRLNQLRRTRGLAKVELETMLSDRLILTNSAFGIEYSRPLPPLVQMVGPMIPELTPLPDELRAWVEGGPPVVYANLGTLALASRDQLARMLGAFRTSEFRVLWVLKDELRALLPAQRPASVRVEGWIPSPLSLLSHENVRVFVSHCGVPSVHEALHAGTPIVGIPMLGGQRDMAMRVVDAGVGLMLDKTSFTEADLSSAILRLLRDDAFRRPIPAIQSSFRLAGGAPRAADLIEHFVTFGAAHFARSSRGARP